METSGLTNHLPKGWQTFSVKDQRVNIAGFAGHKVSVTILRLCCVEQKQLKTTREPASVARCPKKLHLWTPKFNNVAFRIFYVFFWLCWVFTAACGFSLVVATLDVEHRLLTEVTSLDAGHGL